MNNKKKNNINKKTDQKTLSNKEVNIDKSISAIREAILSSNIEVKNERTTDNIEDDTLLLTNIIVPPQKEYINKNEKVRDINEDKNLLIEKDTDTIFDNSENLGITDIKETITEERGLEGAINREIKPLIKTWIDMYLKDVVKEIVKEEISFITKLSELPKKR